MPKLSQLTIALAKSGLCATLMSVSLFSLAQTTTNPAHKKAVGTPEGDTLVVIASNNETSNDPLVGNNEIKVRQPQSVGEILKNVPGVQAGHPVGLGQRFKIRGMDDQFINVTIDGARQEGYHFHHSGNYGIDPELLKQVDISVGSNSITYDTGAIGGALRFETVDAADLLAPGQLFGAKGKLSYASNGNEFQKSIATYGKAGPVDLLGYFNHRDLNDGKSGRDNHGRDTIPNNGELLNYLLKAKFHMTDDQSISVAKEHYKNDAETNTRLNFGQDINVGFPLVKYKIERDTYNIAYAYAPVDNELIDFKITAYHTEQKSTHMEPRHGSVKGSNSIVETQGIKLRNKSFFDTQSISHGLTYGYEYFDTKMSYNSPKDHIYNHDIEKGKASSLYLEDDIQIGYFHIIPGVRWDHYRYQSVDKANSYLDKSYSRVSKALGLKYELGSATTLFANYTELFRGPLGKEIAMDFTNHSNNLKATTGYNLEGGVITAFSDVFTGNDQISFSGKLFQTNFKNLATTLYARELHNIPKSRLEGFELSSGYQLDGLNLRASYAKVNNKITQGNEMFTKGFEFEPSLGDSITVGASYLFDKTDIELGWNSRFVLSKDSSGLGGKGAGQIKVHKVGYGVSDMYVAWSPKTGTFKNAELLLGVDNILDKRYNEHSYYLNTSQGQEEKGRSYKATLSYKF